MAQAILTLDNTNGWLPIDYSEIEIGRRAYRSGENEYILNGQRVRLKDVSELLANSGLAERTYTIIGQGLVDQALSLRPQERRALFEEAAGIGLYKSKRAETLRRLDETRANLERVNDILAELTPRLRQLKRQANKTRNYDQVASDLRHLLRIWYGFQWQVDQEKLAFSRETGQTAEENWRSGRSIALDLRRKIEAKRVDLQASRQTIKGIEAQRELIRDNLGKARQEVAVGLERQSILLGQDSTISSRIEYLERVLGDAEMKLKEAEREAQAAGSEQEEIRSALERFQQDQGTAEGTILSLESNIASLGDELKVVDNGLLRAEERSVQIEERIAETSASRSDKSELGAAKMRLSNSVLEFKEITSSLEETQAVRTKTSERFEELKTEIDSYQNEVGRLRSKQFDIRESLSRIEAKIEVHEQQTPAAGDVPGNVSITGRLFDFISAPPEYQLALTSVLVQILDAYVVETEADLWRLIKVSQQEGTDVSAALAGSVTRGSAPIDHPAAKHRLSDLITVKGDYEAALKKLIENVYMVEDGPTALKVIEEFPAGTALVSPDGVVVRSGRLVQNLPHSIELSDSSRISEMEALRVQAADHSLQLNQIEEQVADKLAIVEPMQEEITTLDIELGQLTDKEKLAEFNLAKMRDENNRDQQDFERITRESTQIELAWTKLQALHESNQVKINQLSEKKITVAANIASANEELSRLPVEETKHERSLLEQRLQSARTIAAGRVAVVDSRETTLEQVGEQLTRAKDDRGELHDKQKKLHLASLEVKVAKIEKEYSDAVNRLAPGRKHQAMFQNELETLELTLDKQQTANDNLETVYTQARIESSQQENNVQALKERIQAELGIVSLPAEHDTVQTPLPISEVVEVLPEVEELPDDIERSIMRLRGQLNRMGAINPDAPREYQELQNRIDFLTEQFADLEATSERLKLIIEELDELTSKSFSETVERVDREFREVFTRLFGGGAAQLVLTDPDELAISGVDIVARLPGRRAQNLGLLSGGERALTAAALVFSLLKVSPTPFCVLDEVDAMLDEANITRFRDLLNELSQSTQFVVITHNRGTIQVADNVYGVSMGPDSSSQVISIKPEAYIAAAAAR